MGKRQLSISPKWLYRWQEHKRMFNIIKPQANANETHNEPALHYQNSSTESQHHQMMGLVLRNGCPSNTAAPGTPPVRLQTMVTVTVEIKVATTRTWEMAPSSCCVCRRLGFSHPQHCMALW